VCHRSPFNRGVCEDGRRSQGARAGTIATPTGAFDSQLGLIEEEMMGSQGHGVY